MSEIEAQPVPMLGGSWAGFSRPARSADEQAQAAISAAARALPDERFDGDCEVRRLRADHEMREAVLRDRLAINLWLKAEHLRVLGRIKAAEDGLMWAVLASAANRDDDFQLARAHLAALGAEKTLEAGIGDAMKLLGATYGSGSHLQEAADKALGALNDHLHQLKLKEVASCSE